MIRVVLFDFGGVLTESGKKGFIRRTIAALYDLPEEAVDIADLHLNLRRGKTNEKEFFRELHKRYGRKITKEAFVQKAQEGLLRSAEVYELASHLRSHGIKTGILSNVFAMNAEELRGRGFYEDFDPVILSYEEGWAKPEKELYHIAVDRLGASPREILFIDDQEKCMPPARELGMHTILATSPQQIVSDTKALIAKLNHITV